MGELSVRLMSRSIARISSDATCRIGGGRGLSADAEDTSASGSTPTRDEATLAAYASTSVRTGCSASACVVLVWVVGGATQPFWMSNIGESLR